MDEVQSKMAYMRNFVFGVEDSLVSTVGLLSGIAVGGMGAREIILTGAVLIFVEALSMAAGSFLSESSAEDYALHKEGSIRTSLLSSVIMFFSYFIAGFVPIAPYIFMTGDVAFYTSIALSTVSLGFLGAFSASLSKTSPVKTIGRMVIIGGSAIVVGVLVGGLVKVVGA